MSADLKFDLKKAERLQSKIEAFVNLLRDPELKPILPFLLEQEASQPEPIIAVHNGNGIPTKNRTYSGITQAVRSMRSKLPQRFTRADALQKLKEHGFPATDNSLKDALYGMYKRDELNQYIKQGQATEYEFKRGVYDLLK
jgi:hypothetical protein